MKKSVLFALWGGMFVVCACLGFIPEPEGAVKWLLVAAAAAFFVPPMLLVQRASAQGDRRTLALIRNLAALSLVLTVVLLILNFLSIAGSQLLGTILYDVLIIVSSPMVCGQYWVLGLFGWAYLMIDAMTQLKKK